MKQCDSHCIYAEFVFCCRRCWEHDWARGQEEYSARTEVQGLGELSQLLQSIRREAQREHIEPATREEDTGRSGGSRANDVGNGRAEKRRMAIVFGREDAGFLAGELHPRAVSHVCAIPMSSAWGVESLSLSQAAPCALSRLYEDTLLASGREKLDTT